jgi:anti-sigma factor RsiW
MKNCWPFGDLRAYIDGEMTPDARAAIAVHLEACPACGARYRELTERAAWVSAAMDLSGNAPAIPAARPRPRRWLVGAVGLAASLGIALLLLPKRAPERPAPVVAKVVVPPAPVQTAAPAVHPAVHHAAPRRQDPPEEFLRLDDEPIETATIVRVSAEDGALQADLIVGPDGRAHAIRVVRNQ